MTQITVKELATILQEEVREGNGNKVIVVADDPEGNGYHGLFFGITSDKEDLEAVRDYIYDSVTDDPDKFVILG